MKLFPHWTHFLVLSCRRPIYSTAVSFLLKQVGIGWCVAYVVFFYVWKESNPLPSLSSYQPHISPRPSLFFCKNRDRLSIGTGPCRNGWERKTLPGGLRLTRAKDDASLNYIISLEDDFALLIPWSFSFNMKHFSTRWLRTRWYFPNFFWSFRLWKLDPFLCQQVLLNARDIWVWDGNGYSFIGRLLVILGKISVPPSTSMKLRKRSRFSHRTGEG